MTSSVKPKLPTYHDLRATLAEFLGTGLLVFFGPGTVVVTGTLREGELTADRLLTIALAFGFIVAVVVAATGRLSGAHINPAVTCAALITGHISPIRGLLYFGGQLGGAAIGSLLIVAVVPGDGGSLGATSLGSNVRSGAGLLTEIILTFALVFVIFGTAVDPKGPNSLAPVLIGLTVAVDIMIGGPLTGASMNPARSFGPALVAVEWADHWIYWAGPIVGGTIAALVYQHVYLRWTQDFGQVAKIGSCS